MDLGNFSGTPFVLKTMSVKQNSFLRDYFKCDITPFEENGPPASSVRFNKKGALKAAVGEYLERSSVFINNGRFKQENIIGIDMTTHAEVTIPLYRMLLHWGVPPLNKQNLEGLYSDTCGLASHITSFQSIQSAFFEFFERQSLLYGWFTNTPGKRIEISDLQKDPDLKEQIDMAFGYIDELHFIDISLSEKAKVIICIATGKEIKGVGLSAHWDYKNAILGTIKELFQYIAAKGSRYDDNNINENEVDALYYSKHFMNEVNSESLKSDFNYLISNSKNIEIDIFDRVEIKEVDFGKIIAELSNELEIDFILCFVPVITDRIRTKIVKIMTTRGFHHMFTSAILPEEIPMLKGHHVFYNKGKVIPFG
ncbi:YcaO-like family protein [Paenibacillus sp.]|uniref:YcaO-like family protein n=1 Tax=Paenibacillus sp. TaxID=58172 RepID=UPI00281A8CB4|nr:YcaO-like family protein [Paenibacillus sp.]MDR0267854.1 YcaO-like family protein [Paenibacillus sp.]